MTRSRIASDWFNLGAKAFAQAFPGILRDQAGSFYVCPLCIHAFPFEAIAARTLTLEDVPPQSVGGRRLVLTCRRCNNRAGHDIDAHMRHAENVVEGLIGTLGRPQPVRMVIGDVRVNLQLHTTPGPQRSMFLTGWPKSNSRQVQQAFEQALEQATRAGKNWGGFTLEFHRDQFSPRRAAISWLRAAFLVAFARFGYWYAFNPALASVRAQIAKPMETMIETFKLSLPPPIPSRKAFLRVEEPEWCDGLAVQFGRHVVFLPHTNDRDFYARLSNHAREAGAAKVQFHGKELPWPTRPEHGLDTRNEERS